MTNKTKQKISAHVAQAYLYGLYICTRELFECEEYSRAFAELEKCISNMIATPYHGDIVESYVIIEQERET